MANNPKIEEVRDKLYEKLKPSGWADKLKGFILSDDFYKILENLYTQAQEGARFTPTLKQVFRAFEECPYPKLHTIIVGQDPYPMMNEADGIAFSCSNTNKAAVSLRYIFGEIERTFYKDVFMKPENAPLKGALNPDLTRWSNQGILMLNTALTTNVGKIGAHYDLWKPFMTYLFDILNSYNTGLIYVYLGKQAKEWSVMVNDTHNHKLFATHPAYAAYTKSKTWESDNLFPRISELVLKYYDQNIVW
jgi:uracil-DNA glycosylase